MKRLLVISLLLATVIPAAGQHVKAAMRKAKEREEAMARRILMDDGGTGLSGYLSYRVMDGDMLFKDFEGALRKMTISQGAVLLKLIDRETGQSSYSIIHDYKNGIAAGFWQGIAKLFDNDLKSEYDPEGADRDLEGLVQAWQNGTFKSLYWSIFWEDPPEVKVPDFYKTGASQPNT